MDVLGIGSLSDMTCKEEGTEQENINEKEME